MSRDDNIFAYEGSPVLLEVRQWHLEDCLEGARIAANLKTKATVCG